MQMIKSARLNVAAVVEGTLSCVHLCMCFAFAVFYDRSWL